jgi:hypothetical protein
MQGIHMSLPTHSWGSAPRLQKLELWNVPFPTLPKFLLSANDLVDLHLEKITGAGYISPDTMAACLSVLRRLRSVRISFDPRSSFPNQTNQHPPPVTRTVLPALASFVFEGLSEYSEELISRIDAPLLNQLHLSFFYQPTFTCHSYPGSYVASKSSRCLLKLMWAFIVTPLPLPLHRQPVVVSTCNSSAMC